MSTDWDFAAETILNPAAAGARYEVGPRLGLGGLGEVFLAWDTRLLREVALKRFAPDPGTEGVSQQEMLHEAIHLAAVQHPNVVTVYDFGEDASGPFLIMELVQGETLEEVVARGAFPLADFLSPAQQTLEGLAAAHEAGLVHGDLKPGNIMLKAGPAGTLIVKILDFGIASDSTQRQLPAELVPGEDGLPSILGTVGFMAPEQFEKKERSIRSDLYCAGSIFYYALAGFEPFRGKTVSAVIASHLEHRVVPIGEVRKDLPPAICAWIMQLIERQPEDRPASAAEALMRLREASAETRGW